MAQSLLSTGVLGRALPGTPDVGEIARLRLRQCPYPILRQVHCRYHEGVLILCGNVPTFYMKQIAQTVVSSLDQVEQIDNRIVVAL